MPAIFDDHCLAVIALDIGQRLRQGFSGELCGNVGAIDHGAAFSGFWEAGEGYLAVRSRSKHCLKTSGMNSWYSGMTTFIMCSISFFS